MIPRPLSSFALIAFAVLLPVSAAAQQLTPHRTPDGRPNFNGIWQAMNAASFDIQDHVAQLGVPAGQGVVEGNEIPYQEWAVKQKAENLANRRQRDLMERRGFQPGVPRAMYLPLPFQIVQTPQQMTMLFEYAHVTRNIFMNRPHIEGEVGDIEWWMCDSRGRWEGETLIVTVKHCNPNTWFDRSGNFHSNAIEMVERYTPMGPDHIQYEVTVTDPKVFTRPWKMSMPLYRRKEANVRILEYEAGALIEEEIEKQYERQMINGID